MNSKGQESATFEFLVVAIMGLAILVIVIGISGYFSNLRYQASEKLFNDALKSAVSSPNGEIILAKGIYFQASVRGTDSLEKSSGIPAECLELDSFENDAFSISDSKDFVTVRKSIEANVYYRCVLGPTYGTGSDCEESCLVSFGKEILPESPLE